jgi:hypothetical protein
MLSLIETITGFAAIMLMLSLLVKTLTSVFKNYLDYYSDNLEHEVKRLVLETTGKTWDFIRDSKDTPGPVKNIMKEIHWDRLGDEFLNPEYLTWFLQQLDKNAVVSDLAARLRIHVANVKYTFEMRMKNLALAAGLGLCLLCNINAFTIWKSLYSDQQLRATFADKYADKATTLAEAQAKAAPQADAAKPADAGNPAEQPNPKPTKDQLDAQLKDFRQNMQGFLTDVSFGIGRIWREECLRLKEEDRRACRKEMSEQTAKMRLEARGVRNSERMAEVEKIQDADAKKRERQRAIDAWNAEEKADSDAAALKLAQEKKETQSSPEILVYEFFGSLLTGIIVSIGAPYWHDILQALSSLRSTGKAKA